RESSSLDQLNPRLCFGIALLTSLWKNKGQTVHDLMAKTQLLESSPWLAANDNLAGCGGGILGEESVPLSNFLLGESRIRLHPAINQVQSSLVILTTQHVNVSVKSLEPFRPFADGVLGNREVLHLRRGWANLQLSVVSKSL